MPQTVPALNEIEVNITRLLGAALTLMARTPLFLQPFLPEVSLDEYQEALGILEAQNRSLILNASLPAESMLEMQRNSSRITQLSVLSRIVRHLERSTELLAPGERALVIRFLGPAADAIFLLGTRILSHLLDPAKTETLTTEMLPWELMMVDGALKSAQGEIAATTTLSPMGRRCARSALWSFLIARDALLTVGSR